MRAVSREQNPAWPQWETLAFLSDSATRGNQALSLVSTGDLARQKCWITTSYHRKSQWKQNILRSKPINTPREVRLEKIKKF